MCLLAYISPDAPINWSGLEISCENNPDGFGWALHTGDQLLTGRSMDADVALATFDDAIKAYPGAHALFHSRWATHGTKNEENCHPFWVGEAKQTVLAHNGVLRFPMPKNEWRSDTRYYAETSLAQRSMTFLDKPKKLAKLADQIKGSKFVIFTLEDTRRPFYIVNEQDGHWIDGTWWSNSSYMPYQYNHGTSTSKKTSTFWWEETDQSFADEDYCWTCAQQLSEAEKGYWGYCLTCESCLDCHEGIDTCLCYSPEHAFDEDKYEEVAAGGWILG